MKINRKRGILIFFLIAVALILCVTLMDRNGVRTHDVSQLVPSKHDAVISNDYNVEIIGDKKISLESEAFKVIIRNGSDYMLYYGVLSGLEVFYGERWYKVPFKDNVGIL